jgi:hypothetical protein
VLRVVLMAVSDRSVWAIVWRESSWVGLSTLLANLCELALPVVFSWLIQCLSDQVRLERELSHPARTWARARR